jgi:ABC-type multidrug transport system ATPase subunit
MSYSKVIDDKEEGLKSPSKVISSLSFSKHEKKQDIAFSAVNFSVKLPNGENKDILKDCWGKVETGQVCAVLGPSGSGKSSLLNVLAGRSSTGGPISVNGCVQVGGEAINPVKYRQNIAYVMQDDALYATSTPREALRFSARLRLPSSTADADVEARVEEMIQALGLEDCCDVMIGGALIKGISGGQRKRTSVGIELITNPSLLFLDEPTSGLDSYTSYNLVHILKNVAASNSAVMCTIHQPSSEIFELFDTCIFMKSGRVFYSGPVNALASHFSSVGFECPLNYNPSDYVMFICQTTGDEELEKRQLFAKEPESLVAANAKRMLSVANGGDEESTGAGGLELGGKASFSTQLALLCGRELSNTHRDVGALIGRFGITAFLNLLFGCIFFEAGGQDNGNKDEFNAHYGALVMVFISSMFGSASPMMLAFPFERPMFLREYSTGTYSVVAYFISKSVVELPMAFAQVLLQYIIAYFLIDLQGTFFWLCYAAWLLGLCAASQALLLGCVVPDVKSVTELGPLLYVPQLLFAGFFIPVDYIPVWLRWAQYLCSLRYALSMAIADEFNPTSKSCNTSPAARVNCETVLQLNDIEEDNWWIYMLLLIVIFVVFRMMAAVVLAKKASKFF